MPYVILPNLQVILFLMIFDVKSFQKVFMCRLAIGCIIIYCTTIILNILEKIVHYMELKVVKSWLT